MSSDQEREESYAGIFYRQYLSHLTGRFLWFPYEVSVLPILSIVGRAIVSAVVAIPFLFIWNWLMPEVFGLVSLGYWEIWGLVFLIRLLFPFTR